MIVRNGLDDTVIADDGALLFKHERLDVWKKAVEYAKDVYQVSQGFPAAERFGLQAQLRRASLSVSTNIAEGSGRSTRADFARFISMAYGSLMESVCECTLAAELGYITEHDYHRLRRKADEIARMLSGLRYARER